MIADIDGDFNDLLNGQPQPSELPILPVRNLVLFPGVVSPILIGRDSSMNLVSKAERSNNIIGIICQLDPDVEEPGKDDLFTYGVFARVVRQITMPNGTVTAIIQGMGRLRLLDIVKEVPYLMGRGRTAQRIDARQTRQGVAHGHGRPAEAWCDEYINNDEIPDEATFAISNIHNNVMALNFICSNMPFSIKEKMKLLSVESLKERLFGTMKALNREINLQNLKADIRNKTREDIDEQQKNYFLQQQIKNLQAEMGNESSPEKRPAGKVVQQEMARRGREDLQKGDGQTGQPEPAVARLQRAAELSADFGLAAVGRIHQGRPRPEACAEDTGPRPLRHGEGEGAHPGVHGRAVAARRPEEPHPLSLRSSGRGQDLAGQVDCRRHEAQVRAHVAGRTARRGRDSRTPPHLHRRHARTHHQEHPEGRLEQPRVHPRRDRQGDAKHRQRRPRIGTARSARPGAEQRLPRQLPRRGLRPVEGALHRHGQQPVDHSPVPYSTAWRLSR